MARGRVVRGGGRKKVRKDVRISVLFVALRTGQRCPKQTNFECVEEEDKTVNSATRPVLALLRISLFSREHTRSTNSVSSNQGGGLWS